MTSIDLMSSILSAKSEEDFLKAIEKASRACGFDRVLIGMQWFNSNGEPRRHITSGYPLEWQKIYYERKYALIDPTVSYCETYSDPIIWSDTLFEGFEARDLMEEAKKYGLGFGVSIPVHERLGVKSMVSLSRDRPVDSDPREMSELMSGAQVISSCAHFAFRKIQRPESHEAARAKLSDRERECLHWVAMGKSSWEIGAILKISEATAIFHIKNLMEKLDVKNRSQAIAVAFRLGILN